MCSRLEGQCKFRTVTCLTAGEHKAEGDLWLCPEVRLLADGPDAPEDVIYDGCGHRIVLPSDVSPDDPVPLILIGAGRTLLLRHVRIVHAASLPACMQLSPGGTRTSEQSCQNLYQFLQEHQLTQ